jgi:phosphoglycerate dehydrogenase-like enzyme
LIDARRLALMKRSAFLVNIAHGPVVHEDAIYAALRDPSLGGAALDVWWQYPKCQSARNRDPGSACKKDPLAGDGIGLSR